MANQLFQHLKSGLHRADSNAPYTSTLALGFTKIQMMKMDLKKPRLIWYDVSTKTFYDQGDSTKIKKSDWTKVNQFTFKKDKPITNLQYYIPINNDLIAESDKPLD
jgi:hypothetical protein